MYDIKCSFLMINNVGHTINDEINTQNIGDHIVGAQYYIYIPTHFMLHVMFKVFLLDGK